MQITDLLTISFLVSAWTGEAPYLRGERSRTATLTLTCCGLLVVCLLAQLAQPALLTLFERNAARIVAGEWWRMGTALFFQDGWFWGGVTNVLAFFLIGGLVERGRSRSFWLIVVIVGAFAAECFGLKWQPIGAGNSVATCALAGSLILSRPLARMPIASRVPRGIAIVLAVLLAAVHDVHGIAAVTGMLLGLLIPARGIRLDSGQRPGRTNAT